MMATRTTITRTTVSARGLSADQNGIPAAGLFFKKLVLAYFNCRQAKRNTNSALAFEADLERNLSTLCDDLLSGAYRPSPSVFFVITRPRPREVWAADFRDRIVHHLIYDQIAPRFERSFIADSCACIPGRGTLYGAKRLERKVRSLTQNWAHSAFYLKADVSNFFVSIDKQILRRLLWDRVPESWWRTLIDRVLMHDPRGDYRLHCDPALLRRVPEHKRLLNQDADHGLPIGNLTSQFFANVYLDQLDQFVKRRLGVKHYIRYVDDFVLLNESPAWLNYCLAEIEDFLADRLSLELNPTKTILQPVDRGVDFVGQVIKPWRRTTRRRTKLSALKRLRRLPAEDVFAAGNSYLGLMGQASADHHDRAEIANVLRARGHAVKSDLSKIYRRKQA